jgi:hypothetical protein
MRRLITMLATLALIGASVGGCKKDEERKPSKSSKQASKADQQKVDEEQAAEKIHPFMRMREAFGLPFPPEVAYVKKGDNFVEVGTRLSVDELEAYFKERLVDYEFIRPGKRHLRILGLRSYMPSIWIFYHSPRTPVAVRYVRPAPPAGQSAPGGLDTVASNHATGSAKRARHHHKKGAPVNLTMPDGTPLAPGARWGESYTPPPNTPLNKPRFRANFGKPFGEWILD